MHRNDTQIKVIDQLQRYFDEELFEQLLAVYRPYIRYITYRFYSYDLSQDDLIQIGHTELYLSVLDYDRNVQPIFIAYFKARLINAIKSHLRPYLTMKRGYGMVTTSLDAPANIDNGYTPLVEYIKSETLMPEDFLFIQDKQEGYYSKLSEAELTSLLYGMEEHEADISRIFNDDKNMLKNARNRARRKFRQIEDMAFNNEEDNVIE